MLNGNLYIFINLYIIYIYAQYAIYNKYYKYMPMRIHAYILLLIDHMLPTYLHGKL